MGFSKDFYNRLAQAMFEPEDLQQVTFGSPDQEGPIKTVDEDAADNSFQEDHNEILNNIDLLNEWINYLALNKEYTDEEINQLRNGLKDLYQQFNDLKNIMTL